MDNKIFNLEDFDIKLDTDIIGRNFIYTEDIDSTNSFLLNSADIQKEGTVLLAEYQSKGRGRKDREWLSLHSQNLTFSCLFSDKYLQIKPNIINLASAVAVARSIENLFQVKTNLKWPNDVLINGKKVCGILMESSVRGKAITRLVLGIGINVNQPSFLGRFNYAPTSIRLEFKKEVSRERLLSEVLNNLEVLLNEALVNPQKIISFWKSHTRFLGEKIKIKDDNQEKYGIFEDLDDDGFLILRSGTKSERIVTGEIGVI